MFTSQPNLIVDSRTHPTLHPNCHHRIIYAKFNLKIHYPPPYTRMVWHYKDSNDDFIRRAINQFNWERDFENKNVDKKVLTFSKTVMNILSNFIPHELIVCDDKDPPWFNTKIKSLIHEKIKTHKVLRKNTENNQQIEKLKSLQNRLKWKIDDSKQNYYSRLANRLLNVQRNPKPYWSMLNTSLNKKKVPIIFPLFHENEFVTDFKKKAELFNSFFAKQRSSNSSFIFFTKRFYTHKKHKNAHKRTKTKKVVLNALKKHLRGKIVTYSLISVFMLFMCIKTFKRKKVACLTFCAFCAFCAFYAFYPRKKRLSESCLFTFCAFYASGAFCAFCAFCACEIFS